jgi:hypothetical protein
MAENKNQTGKLSKDEQLKANIKEAFNSNKQADHLFVTSDGQIFLNGSYASNHSKMEGNLKRKEALQVEKVLRSTYA